MDGVDLATTGLYRLENETLTLISAGTLNDSKLMVNTSINHSGHYVLLGKEQETDSITTGTPETIETPPDMPTQLIMAVAILLAAVLLIAYMYREK